MFEMKLTSFALAEISFRGPLSHDVPCVVVVDESRSKDRGYVRQYQALLCSARTRFEVIVKASGNVVLACSPFSSIFSRPELAEPLPYP